MRFPCRWTSTRCTISMLRNVNKLNFFLCLKNMFARSPGLVGPQLCMWLGFTLVPTCYWCSCKMFKIQTVTERKNTAIAIHLKMPTTVVAMVLFIHLVRLQRCDTWFRSHKARCQAEIYGTSQISARLRLRGNLEVYSGGQLWSIDHRWSQWWWF